MMYMNEDRIKWEKKERAKKHHIIYINNHKDDLVKEKYETIFN